MVQRPNVLWLEQKWFRKQVFKCKNRNIVWFHNFNSFLRIHTCLVKGTLHYQQNATTTTVLSVRHILIRSAVRTKYIWQQCWVARELSALNIWCSVANYYRGVSLFREIRNDWTRERLFLKINKNAGIRTIIQSLMKFIYI